MIKLTKTAIIALTGSGLLAACAPAEKKPEFDYQAATSEEKQAYLQKQSSYLYNYVDRKMINIGMKVDKVMPNIGSGMVTIKMKCGYGGHMDCGRPKKYAEAQAKRKEMVCKLYRHMNMSKHNLHMKWNEHSNGGGVIMTVTVNRAKCGMTPLEA